MSASLINLCQILRLAPSLSCWTAQLTDARGAPLLEEIFLPTPFYKATTKATSSCLLKWLFTALTCPCCRGSKDPHFIMMSRTEERGSSLLQDLVWLESLRNASWAQIAYMSIFKASACNIGHFSILKKDLFPTTLPTCHILLLTQHTKWQIFKSYPTCSVGLVPEQCLAERLCAVMASTMHKGCIPYD